MLEKALQELLAGVKNCHYEQEYSDLLTGQVVGVNPLQIKINDRVNDLVIDEELLSLTSLVQDFEVEIDEDFKSGIVYTEEAGHHSHNHEVKGVKPKLKLKMYFGLKVGEQVMLLRVGQGKHYIVLDRYR